MKTKMHIGKDYAFLFSILISMSMILITSAQKNILETPSPAPGPSHMPLDWNGCMPQCIPICMNLQGASNNACETACGAGCTQLVGKGNIEKEVDFE